MDSHFSLKRIQRELQQPGVGGGLTSVGGGGQQGAGGKGRPTSGNNSSFSLFVCLAGGLLFSWFVAALVQTG